VLRNAHPAVVFVAMAVGYLLVSTAFGAARGSADPLADTLFEAVVVGGLFAAFAWIPLRKEPDGR
jgi:hypothetical protein